MNKVAALQKKKRKDFIPYFIGFVIFLYCTVHLVSFTAKAAQDAHPLRVRRALGKKIICGKSFLCVTLFTLCCFFKIMHNIPIHVCIIILICFTFHYECHASFGCV